MPAQEPLVLAREIPKTPEFPREAQPPALTTQMLQINSILGLMLAQELEAPLVPA
jgi:hypothetical protein